MWCGIPLLGWLVRLSARPTWQQHRPVSDFFNRPGPVLFTDAAESTAEE
jgi:hypothetical protein